MTARFRDATRDVAANDIITRAGTNARLHIRTGAQPASCEAARTGALLVDMAMSNPIGTVTPGTGVLQLSAISAANASASGDAGYAYIWNPDTSQSVFDGACGTSGTEFTMPSITISISQTITAPFLRTVTPMPDV